MFRTAAAAVLVLALGAATTASAAQYSVSTAGKSDAQIRAEVTQAANKACTAAYSSDVLIAYEREDCVRDSVAAALSKAPQTAMNAAGSARDASAIASR
jgi:hypothetical protein